MKWAKNRSNVVCSDPQEDAKAADAKPTSDSPDHGRRSVFTKASQSVIVLLRVTGKSGGPGWISLMYAVTLFSLQTF